VSAAIAVSRLALPTLGRNRYAPASGVAQGAYVLADALGGTPEVILIAEGIRSWVASMHSREIFEGQTRKYQKSVLPPNVTARIAIEKRSISRCERYIGASGRIIEVESFPAPAPLKAHRNNFGVEPDAVASAARELLGR
jgi:transketolase